MKINQIFKRLDNTGLPMGVMLHVPFFYLASLYYLHGEPSRYLTGGIYIFFEGWAILVLMKRIKIRRFEVRIFDIFFVFFTFVILVSLLSLPGPEMAKPLAFLVVYDIVPYFLARSFTYDEVECLLLTVILTAISAIAMVCWELIHQMSGASIFIIKFGLFGFSHAALVAGGVIGSLICVIVGYLLGPNRNMFEGALAKISVLFMAFLVFLVTYLCARGGLVASVASCGILILMASWARTWQRVQLAILLGACITISLVITPVSQRNFLQSSLYLRLDQGEKLDLENATPLEKTIYLNSRSSILLRIFLYEKAIEFFLEHPLVGIGAARYGKVIGDARIFPHSTLLQAFAERGSIGGLLILSFIVFLLLGLKNVFSSAALGKERTLALVLGGLWGFYLISDQIYGNYFTAMPFFLISGAIGSLTTHSNLVQSA